jgi:hypothetical protein
MKRIVVDGWKVDFNKVGFTKLLRYELGYRLSVAKGLTDGLLEGQPVILEVDDSKLEQVISELEGLRATFHMDEES